jgi:hypothetical protein
MAEQMLRDYPETPRGIWTDARTKPGTIIVGIAIRGRGVLRDGGLG